MVPRFEVISEFSPAGDQPKAIEALAELESSEAIAFKPF